MLDHQAMQSDFQKIKTTKKHLQQLQCFCKGSLRSCWLCGRTTCPQFWKMANHQLSPAFSRLVGLWDSGFPLVRFFPCWYEPKIHNTEAIYPEDGYDIISCFCILVCFFFGHEGLMTDKLFVIFPVCPTLALGNSAKPLKRPQHIFGQKV